MKWHWFRVHTTRFYLLWRETDDGRIERHAGVCDDFGNLIFVGVTP